MSKINFKSLMPAAVMLLASSSLFAQIFEVGSTGMVFNDPARGNRVIETVMYYPADVSGWNVPLGLPVEKTYPVVVFGHDEATSFSNYQYIWNSWTRQGFIVTMVLTEMTVPMDVEEYAKDLAFVAAKFKAMRHDVNSFYYKRFNNRSCIIGHGKGGSAAIIAAQHFSDLTTVITLAANETVPSAIAAASLVTVPSVVVAAGQDCVSPAGTVQEAIFNNINSDCKTFMNYTATPRCHFAQNAGVCTNSQINCGGPTPYTWQATNQELTWVLVSFLRYYLKFNAPALAKFEWKLQQKQQDFLYVMSCNMNSAAREGWELEDEAMRVSLFPNPLNTGRNLTMTIESEFENNATVIITNVMGQLVATQEVELDGMYNQVTIPTHHLRKGNYLVSVHGISNRISKPLIIH